jgi:lipopolysaccharide heptosyltransferase II
MPGFQKICIIRLSSIGDIILTTPLLRSIRKKYPDASITYITKKQYAGLLVDSPYISELIAFDKSEGFRGLRNIKRRLKSQQFDAFLDIHKNWRSRFLRWGLGAQLIASYPKYIIRRALLVKLKINFYRHIRPVYLRYFEAARKLGVQYDGEGSEIHFPVAATEKVKALLSSLGYKFDTQLVVICPGATYFNKKWLSGGFVKTARHLINAKSAFVIMHGGPEDKDQCKIIATETGPGAFSMAGTLSLPETAALLRLSTLVIANDSGLLHLAQSQKRPVVGIYGPTTRELGFFPIEQNSTVVQTSLSCRPCTPKGLNYCPKGHFRCMKDITPEMVIEAAMPYLGTRDQGLGTSGKSL